MIAKEIIDLLLKKMTNDEMISVDDLDKIIDTVSVKERTGRLGNIRACAREIVNEEIIYA